MRTVYSLYKIKFLKIGVCELTVEAKSRKGGVYYLHLKQLSSGYWEGGSDFGFSGNKRFKGIVMEFFKSLVNEARDYDKRWHDLHCVVRIEEGGSRPLTWEETYRGGTMNEDKPAFKGGITFKTL